MTEKEEMINDIKRVSSDFESVPSRKSYETYTQDKSEFHSAYDIVKKFGNWKTALESCGFSTSAPPSKEECLKDISEINQKTEGILTVRKYKANRKESDASVGQIYRVFESWSEALNMLSIDMSKYQNNGFDKKDCLKAVKRVADVLKSEGETLSRNKYDIYSLDSEPSSSTISKKLDSWTRARDLAGFPVENDINTETSKEECVYWLNKVLDEENTSTRYYKENRPDTAPARSTVQSKFNSWKVAVSKSDYEYSRTYGCSKKYTRQDLIDALNKASEFCDGNLTVKKYKKFNENGKFPSYGTITRFFDGWNDALQKASIETISEKKNSVWSDEEIILNLKRFISLYEKHTRSNYKKYRQDYEAPSRIVIVNKFGNWTTAISEVGGEPSSRGRESGKGKQSEGKSRKYQREDIIEELRKFSEEYDSLTLSNYNQFRKNKSRSIPSRSTITKYFSSWSNALDELSLETETSGRKKYTNEDILEYIKKLYNSCDSRFTAKYYKENKTEEAPSINTIQKRIGWKKSKEILDIDEDYSSDYSGKYTKKEIISILRRVIKSTNSDTLSKAQYDVYRQSGDPSINVIRKHIFDSWNEAITEAQIETNRAASYQEHTEEDCIESIEYVSSMIDGKITMRKYRNNKKTKHPSVNFISKYFGWSRCLDKSNIDYQKTEEENDRKYGPNWNRKRLERLRKDDFKCQICGITQEEAYEKHSRGLQVHHIIKITKFVDPEVGNHLSNLVTLCLQHHGEIEVKPTKEQLKILKRGDILVSPSEKKENVNLYL